MIDSDAQVIVIGGGVVGCAVAYALARRGVAALLLEAERDLGLGASGANSGILHTGFDSHPGELETALILRAARLRGVLLAQLDVSVWRCGARLRPRGPDERGAVARLAENARFNGVEAHLEGDGALRVPGESVTDPVAFVQALASAARAAGAEIRCNARVQAISGERGLLAAELAGGARVQARALVNCAGLFADEVALMAGDELLSVYPRKGEFLVFEPPPGAALEEILLPVPSALGKGVLVFPTLEGQIVAGPTARERDDKRDWSVEADAADLIMAKALLAYPPLQDAEQVGAYAGLRPAGRGTNYVIEHSRARRGVVHVAAIRSTGLSASLAIGEHVAAMLAETGLSLGPPAGALALSVQQPASGDGPWWRRAARHHAREADKGALGGAA
ncbi:MAG TPA: FAD-dependent oxidoreductase [Solirubrobacteraceae bacterium]|nr:FAD-dependent oxidoreductase [Solirubrobacteraceae bacterium]